MGIFLFALPQNITGSVREMAKVAAEGTLGGGCPSPSEVSSGLSWLNYVAKFKSRMNYLSDTIVYLSRFYQRLLLRFKVYVSTSSFKKMERKRNMHGDSLI